MVQDDMEKYVLSIKKIFEIGLKFKGLSFINVGGGIGVPYKDGVTPLNLEESYKRVAEEYAIFRE